MSNDIPSLELAVRCARAADDKLATDIIVLPVGDVLAITEYFVVASASNPRQVRAITDAVLVTVREQTGRGPLRSEGVGEQQWVLVDYGDVVVHVFSEEQRRFYEIERLYKDVQAVDWAGVELS
ncbi:MAG: ribosome silencing factor [Actinobacteria bacterium]|jgi:ribosome-associated protein|nr:ribosome silencing factor [Actinomycetota bacterium]